MGDYPRFGQLRGECEKDFDENGSIFGLRGLDGLLKIVYQFGIQQFLLN